MQSAQLIPRYHKSASLRTYRELDKAGKHVIAQTVSDRYSAGNDTFSDRENPDVESAFREKRRRRTGAPPYCILNRTEHSDYIRHRSILVRNNYCIIIKIRFEMTNPYTTNFDFPTVYEYKRLCIDHPVRNQKFLAWIGIPSHMLDKMDELLFLIVIVIIAFIVAGIVHAVLVHLAKRF